MSSFIFILTCYKTIYLLAHISLCLQVFDLTFFVSVVTIVLPTNEVNIVSLMFLILFARCIKNIDIVAVGIKSDVLFSLGKIEHIQECLIMNTHGTLLLGIESLMLIGFDLWCDKIILQIIASSLHTLLDFSTDTFVTHIFQISDCYNNIILLYYNIIHTVYTSITPPSPF